MLLLLLLLLLPVLLLLLLLRLLLLMLWRRLQALRVSRSFHRTTQAKDLFD